MHAAISQRSLFVLTILLWSYTMASTPASQSASFHLDAPLSRVMPLFTALGERKWAQGWEPQFLSGGEERGSVFRTRTHAGTEVVWIVTDYHPAEGHVSYARLAEGSNMGLVDVACSEPDTGGTDVSVRYTLTAVSGEGETFVGGFLALDHYRSMIEEWRTSIGKALASDAR